jgi:hypothetical protein
MKKIVLCVLFLASFFFIPQYAFAHFLATDGTINLILHIDPGDDPIPGQQAHLYFDFSFVDKSKKFQLNQCNCIVTVFEQSKQIFQKPLIDTSSQYHSIWGADIPFVFPARDIYLIKLQGSPKVAGTFKPFLLSWFFRVEEYPQPTQPVQGTSDPSFRYFAIGFLSIIVLTGVILFFVIRHPNKTQLDKKKSN